jgi:hypothetical protein
VIPELPYAALPHGRSSHTGTETNSFGAGGAATASAGAREGSSADTRLGCDRIRESFDDLLRGPRERGKPTLESPEVGKETPGDC